MLSLLHASGKPRQITHPNYAICAAVFQALNKLPEAQHGTDIMRVREPLLAGQGALYRQTILLSSFASAEMNALMNRTCCNWAGQIKLNQLHQVCLLPGSCPYAALAARAMFLTSLTYQ